MEDYAMNSVNKFRGDYGKTLLKVSSPYFTNEDLAEERTKALFRDSCASHVATLLFLGRVARPDTSVAFQRLCRAVIKWTTTFDAALVRLLA